MGAIIRFKMALEKKATARKASTVASGSCQGIVYEGEDVYVHINDCLGGEPNRFEPEAPQAAASWAAAVNASSPALEKHAEQFSPEDEELAEAIALSMHPQPHAASPKAEEEEEAAAKRAKEAAAATAMDEPASEAMDAPADAKSSATSEHPISVVGQGS